MPNVMGSPSALGFERGDHVCAFYTGTAERDQVLLPFVREGLRAGNKCVCIVDSPEPREMLRSIGEGFDSDVDLCVESQQLELLKSNDAYLREGSFSTHLMIDFLRQTVEAALGGGYDDVRITGEAGWLAQGAPGADEFIEYESELNNFAPQYPQAILCLYDLEQLGGGMVVDIMRTHKQLVLGGLVLDNPHYLSPDEFRATRR